MTRTRAASFIGTSPDMADIDAEVFYEVCLNLINDINLTYDKVTGQNGIAAAETINHDGTSGNGSLLGYPLVNQQINKLLTMTEADSTTYGGELILWGAPVFVPAGEAGRRYRAIVSCKGNPPDIRIKVMNASGTVETDQPMNRISQTVNAWASNDSFITTVEFVTAGLNYITFHTDWSVGVSFELLSVHVFPSHDSNVPANTGIDTAAASNSVTFTATPANTGVLHRLMHDEMVSSGRPVPEALLRTINSNLCALFEYITASPVRGNTALTNADSGATDPATSRFLAHTRCTNGYSTEPLIDFPLWSEGFGAVQVDGTNTCNAAAGGFASPSDWFAVYETNTPSTSYFGVGSVVGFAPDFPAASTMKAAVLCTSSGGTPTGFNFKVALEGGGTTAAAAVSALAGVFYKATPTSVSFTADTACTWTLQVGHSSGKAFAMDELNILGWCLYFEP